MRRPLSGCSACSLACLLASCVGSSAEATPIGPSCGSCAGSVFDLTHGASPIATTATTETWAITYTVRPRDLQRREGRSSTRSRSRSPAAATSSTASLVSAPGGVAKWLEVTGGINAFGCSGVGRGFDCAGTSLPADAAPGLRRALHLGLRTWRCKTGTLFTGLDQASIKARYVDANGAKKGPLLSEDITLGNTRT